MGFQTGIAGVTVNVLDNSALGNPALKGVCAVAGVCERGTLAKPRLIRSWTEFKRFYGGFLTTHLFPLMCFRALQAGAPLLVSRVVHYTDITDPSTFAGTKAAQTYTGAFSLSMEADNVGSWGNSLTVSIQDASSGLSTQCNVVVSLAGYPELTFTQRNFSRTPTTEEIDAFNLASPLAKILGVIGTLGNIVDTFSTGTDDYTGLDYTDWQGNQAAKTGFYAFDDSPDRSFARIALLELLQANFQQQIDVTLEYAELRRKMMYFPAPYDIDGYAAIDYRNRSGAYAIGVAPDTYRGRLTYGGIQITNPANQTPIWITTIADIIGARGKTDQQRGEWISESGLQRGKISEVIRLYYNLGSAAVKAEADATNEAGVNLTIGNETGVYAWGNKTLYKNFTLLQKANIAELVCFLENELSAITKVELFNPNDIETWKAIYRRVAALMDDLVRRRAIFSYLYVGDQDVTNVNEATVNQPDNINNGEYQFILNIFPISALEYITINLSVNSLSASVTVTA